MSTATPAGIAIVGVMYAAFLALGWLGARRARGTDLILGGRAIPLWLAALTMTATWVDGGYLLGTAEGAFASSPSSGWQGGVCFGLSLILGGLLFAGPMRARGFTTLIDPFTERFGAGWAAVLALPAVFGEVFWSAELLVAVGASSAALLGVPLETAVVVSAAIVIAYTMAGGLWSVAYADVLQLALVAVGMAIALPYVLDAVGGLWGAWSAYRATFPDRGGLAPPFTPHGVRWTPAAVVAWWDVGAMLLLGGIPWNCYFQRVLASETPSQARLTSILAGALTITLVGPPLLLGTAAAVYPWPAAARAQLAATPAQALPLLLGVATPPLVALLGLCAIVGAVTSSFSASVLSAASMATWNGVRPFVRRMSEAAVRQTVRAAVIGVGALAAVLALRAQSVQALWFFTSDLVFVLLFPQLVCAMFDPRANRTGSIVAFAVSLMLRLGGGEPLLGIPPVLPYPQLMARLVATDPASWYDAAGAMQWPFRTLAAAAGLVLLPVVSRITSGASADGPRGARPGGRRSPRPLPRAGR